MLLRIRILLYTFFISFQCLGNYSTIVDQLERELEVKVILDHSFKGSWKTVAYQTVEDTIRVENYLKTLLFEFKKYPLGYLNKAKVDNIIICKNLEFKGQQRAAIPDPYKKALYLGIDKNYANDYLIRVMHHELHHNAEYALYGSMSYDFKEWNKINNKKFTYGGGGVVAYENKKVDFYSISDERKGFLNMYSTTKAEEDRCEIVSLIFSDKEKKLLYKKLRQDNILRKKVKLIIKELNSIAETEFIFWRDIKSQI